jgi:CubicO group peptidase (beta-lactamase class C family)
MRDAKSIDRLLSDATASGQVPGVVCIAASESEILYEGAFGKRSLGREAPMTPDTVVWLASMTKALTATAAMQLIERGRIGLDQEARELVPQLGAPQVLEAMDADGKPRLRPAKRPITVRHLLTHTSGFSYEFSNPLMRQYKKAASLPASGTCKDAVLGIPLVFDPGERWEYGISLDWIGKIVEAASGQRLDHYLAEHVFGPLGMNDTAFRISSSMRERLAAVHQRRADGTLVPTPFEVPQEPEFHLGGGGLYGTARDYMSFCRMILGGGRFRGAQLLRPETVALMAQNHIGELTVGDMKSADLSVANDVPANPAMPMKWSLSFMINTVAWPAGRSAGSLSWSGLANTYYWIDPRRKVAGVFLAQLLPFFDNHTFRLFAGFEAAVYRSL